MCDREQGNERFASAYWSCVFDVRQTPYVFENVILAGVTTATNLGRPLHLPFHIYAQKLTRSCLFSRWKEVNKKRYFVAHRFNVLYLAFAADFRPILAGDSWADSTNWSRAVNDILKLQLAWKSDTTCTRAWKVKSQFGRNSTTIAPNNRNFTVSQSSGTIWNAHP